MAFFFSAASLAASSYLQSFCDLLIIRGVLKYQANQTLELSDEELESVAGGTWASRGLRCAFPHTAGFGC